MKKILLTLFFSISINLFCQTEKKEDITINLLKAKLVDNVSVVGIRQLKVTSNDLRKVLIKSKIETKSDNKTKLSSFSLLDTKNKIRYRLADYKGYTGLIGYPELIPFRKSKLFNDQGEEINPSTFPPYDASEKDYFNDFDMEGYFNFELPINFGTSNNPKVSILYFGETEYTKFTAELYFAIKVENINSNYELYYKNNKITDIKFDK